MRLIFNLPLEIFTTRYQIREKIYEFIFSLLRTHLIYEKLSFLSKKNVEPFTFCYQYCRENVVKILFSTSSIELCTILYNMLVKKSLFPFIFPLVRIKNNKTIFKTLSPIILSDSEPEWYLNPDIIKVTEMLKDSVVKLASYFVNKSSCSYLKFLKFSTLAVKNNDKILQGIEGIFEIESQVEILNLIYTIGLGIYRGRGFGMLDIVKGDI